MVYDKSSESDTVPGQLTPSKSDKVRTDIPSGILSPPTSRPNSPVSDFKTSALSKDSLDEESSDSGIPQLDQEDVNAQEALRKEDEIAQAEAIEKMKNVDAERRHQQLMHLLEKSSIYTGFLLERIKAEEEERNKNVEKIKQEKRKSMLHEVDETEEQPKKRGRVSKRKKTTISDVLDKKDLIKRQRLNEQGDSKGTDADEQNLTKEVNKVLQPKLLTGAVLRDYQLYGVNWIKTLYDNGMNGILADEMGLGKTIQTVALISALVERGVKGPFLVVVPLSTLPHWEHEFSTFAPDVPTLLFHGMKNDRPLLYKKVKSTKINDEFGSCFPVVLTSYDMVRIEHKFFSRIQQWSLIVVDEGHRLKNSSCQLIKFLKALRSDNRLLLTGTPLQNNLSELWSLLNFILPDVFDDLDSFQMWFDFSAIREDGGKDKIIANEKEGQVLAKLHQILSPFLLRRIKTDVELKLPPKTEVHVYAIMTEMQEKYYKAILDRKIFELLVGKPEDDTMNLEKNEKGLRKKAAVDYSESFEDMSNGDTKDPESWLCIQNKDVYESFTGTNILKRDRKNAISPALKVIWVQLKKCVNHPYLLQYPTDEQGYAKITEEVLKCSGKMLLLQRMLPELIKNDGKVLIFSTMTKLLDIIEDYLSLYDWKNSRLDGKMSMADRQENIQRFMNDPEYKIFLLSTRAGGLGLNLMAANSVIIFDSDWNPQCDLQAQDRAHRIGQKRKVMVYRFLAKNTIDQKIVERGINKRFLEKMVIHKGKFKQHGEGTSTISEHDLQELFDCEALEALKTGYTNQDVLSDADLAALTSGAESLPKSAAYTVIEEVKSRF